MIFIPFLTSPIAYAVITYQSTNFELPIQSGNYFSSKRVYKSDPDYDQVIRKLPGFHIKTEIQPFLDQEKIRKDLIVVETPDADICSAFGTNFFNKGDAIVFVAPGFNEADKAACHWVMKHEISHIKNNDLFTVPLISCICATAAAVFGIFSVSCFSATLLAIAVGYAAFSLFSRWREAKADDFAIKSSSNEELLGGRRILVALQKLHLEERQNFWTKILTSSDGNNRTDILHPLLTSRIKKIENTLKSKGISIEEAQENPKIERLKVFIQNNLKTAKTY